MIVEYRAVDDHTYSLSGTKGLYQGLCTCGWESKVMTTKIQCELAHIGHMPLYALARTIIVS